MAVCKKPGIRCKYLSLALLLALFIAVGVCQAQSEGVGPENVEDKVIGSIDVKVGGYMSVTKKEILAVTRSRKDEKFSLKVAQEDTSRIGALPGIEIAYFSYADENGNLLLDENGRLELTFGVIQKGLARKITFTGNKALGDKKLIKELDFLTGDDFDGTDVLGGAEAITDLYLEKGYSTVSVTVDREKLAKGNVEYNIQEGSRTAVRKVLFEGNKSFTARELLQVTKTRPKNYLFWPVYYQARQVEVDEGKLMTAYQERGYNNTTVTFSTEFSEDMKWADVTFAIKEGPVYIVDEIIITVNREEIKKEFSLKNKPLNKEYEDLIIKYEDLIREFCDEELLQDMKLKVGDFYSKDRAEFDMRRVLGRFREQGFVDAYVVVNGIFPPDLLGIAKVEIAVIPRSRYKIGRVEIAGNNEVHDKVIRRILDEEGFKPGEWFNADLARGDGTGDLELLLQEMVYTRSTIIDASGAPESLLQDEDDTQPTSVDNKDRKYPRRDANVIIEEGKTGQIMVGAGVASDSGLMGQFRYNQKNFDIMDVPESWNELITGKAFKGAGQDLSITASPGTVQSSFSVSFTESYLYDKPISLQTSLSGFERRFESHDLDRLRGYIGFVKRYPSKWRRGFSFRYENVKVSDLESDAPQEIRDVKGRNELAGVRLFVRKNMAGNRYLRYKGYDFEAGFEQVGGDFTFGKLDATHRWYKTLNEDLAERKTVLEMKFHGGTVIGDAPPFEKFYGGGTSSIRGFKYRGVSTRGLQTNVPAGTAQKKDPIGSDWILTANAEVAVPVAKDVFSALFFVDTAMIDSGGPRASVGIGLQILLPQMFGPVPMRFELATPIMKEDEDDTQIFSFSVGALF